MSITVKKISHRAKQIRRPGESWHSAIKRASQQLKGGKVSAVKYIEYGETKRTRAKKTYRVKRSKKGTFKGYTKVSGVSKTHTDKNRITANIQVGSIASYKAAIRTKVKDRLAKQLLRREMATTKRQRKQISKNIRETKSELNRYC